MWVKVVLILGCYLLGSLPVVQLMAVLRGLDPDKEVDLHLSLWRKVGYLAGGLAVTWDIAKGVIAPLVAWLLGFPTLIVILAGLAVVVGQMWPIFTRFEGEKGNSTGIGVASFIAPRAFGLGLVPVVLGVAFRIYSTRGSGSPAGQRFKFRNPSAAMPLGMLAGFAVFPLAAWGLGQPREVIWGYLGLFGLIVLRRFTSGLKEDLKTAPSKLEVLKNRFLYDHS